ncbi:TlpA family protein disulfide reductase [Kineosporia succinea]|uniref:AhpC/TSA family protein n=1 Tax=Kineosporia succinea TaxID=84632 RepID=A0ABT9P7Z2_9ACTN|nr:TlpA disulfide reductase family protein [Kineosporia succinea]MDP9828814.1 hypothetical protein [Kineosporia succinea]
MSLELSVSQWLNGPPPLLAGRPLFLYAFQMLCPLCVEEGTPMMNTLHASGVTVVGLHTVFENHEAQTPSALAGYVARAGIRFPVGVDRHDGTDDAPVTMRRLLLMGTPSIVSVSRKGAIRERLFGVPPQEALRKRFAKL